MAIAGAVAGAAYGAISLGGPLLFPDANSSLAATCSILIRLFPVAGALMSMGFAAKYAYDNYPKVKQTIEARFG